MVHEVYDSLFFSSNFLFPLEGKCHVVAKGCKGQSNDVILYRYPDRQSAASLATSWSSPPLQAGGTRFNKCGCKGFFIRGRLLSIHRRPPQPSAAKPLSNLRTLGAIAPSNFRTLKPQRGLSIGRVNLREYSPAPPRSRSRPRHRRPTTTLAPKARQT